MSTREYKYFLVLDGGEDLAAMRAGAAHFVGEHDFRNFCKVPEFSFATGCLAGI